MVISWLKKHGYLILLIGAALIFAVRIFPVTCLTSLDSDILNPVLIYQDVVEDGHSIHDWIIGGAPFLFPDYLVVWTLDFLCGNDLLAMEITSILLFSGWMILTTLIYRVTGGTHQNVFFALVLLLCVVICKTQPTGLPFVLLFIPVYHTGAELVCMACLALTLASLVRERSEVYPRLLAMLIILGAASDTLIVIIFTIPTLGALALNVRASRILSDQGLRLSVLLVVSTTAGLCLQHLLPMEMAAGYTDFRAGAALHSVSVILRSLNFQNYFFTTLVFMNILTFLGGVLMWKFGLSRWKDTFSPSLLFILSYGAVLIPVNWSAAILTGNYVELAGNRYVLLSLLLPVFLIIGWISNRKIWNGGNSAFLSITMAAIVLASSWSQPKPDHGYYAYDQTVISNLKTLMAETRTDAGLADYWYANSIRVFSDGKMPMGEISEDGSARYWFTNSQWYLSRRTYRGAPSYGFIMMGNLNADAVRARYGPPARVEKTTDNNDVWVYAPEDAIYFNNIFHELGNRHLFPKPNQFFAPASFLPSKTGIRIDQSMLAREGRDSVGWFIFGPFLDPQAGHYRVEFTYAYEVAPKAGREAIFDSVVQGLGGDLKLDQSPIPFHGTDREVLSREIVVPEINARHKPLQTRIWYNGSGDLRVDSLTLTRLDP